MFAKRIITATLALGLLGSLPLVGQSKKSKQLRQLEQQRKQAQQQIERTDQKIREIKLNSKNEQKQIQLVNERVKQKDQLITILNTEVNAMQQEIDSLGGELRQLGNREQKLQRQYRLSLRSLQRRDRDADLILFLFSSQSLEEAMRRQQFASRYLRSSSDILDTLRAVRSGLQQTKQSLDQHQSEKKKLVELRDQEKKELQTEAARRTEQVKKLQNEQSQLEAQLRKQQELAQQLERRIQQQIAAEIKRAEEQARKAREAREARRRRQTESKRPSTSRPSSSSKPKPSTSKTPEPNRTTEVDEPEERTAEHTGGYAMSNSERALAGSFRQNKGRLPMPVRGRYQLVYRFGKQPHESLKHVQVVKGGIDLRALQDRTAYAVFSGTVSSVLVMSGYETSVILRHGNYLTVYSNLSGVSVRTGQRVQAGQALGTIATPSGEKNALLHFQLWYEQRNQDPWPWLKK